MRDWLMAVGLGAALSFALVGGAMGCAYLLGQCAGGAP
jgi:hypothetical protein